MENDKPTYNEFERRVLSYIEQDLKDKAEMKVDIKDAKEKIVDIRIALSVLQTKSGIIGTVAGLIAGGLVTAFIKFFSSRQ